MLNPQTHSSYLAEMLIHALTTPGSVVLQITLNFRPKYHGRIVPQSAFKAFDKVYQTYCRIRLGQNYNRKRYLQPMTIVGYDRAGSRRSATRPDTLQYYPHLHGITAEIPRTGEDVNFELVLDEWNVATLKTNMFEAPYLQRVSNEESDVSRVLDYNLKDSYYLEQNFLSGDIAWMVWPA